MIRPQLKDLIAKPGVAICSTDNKAVFCFRKSKIKHLVTCDIYETDAQTTYDYYAKSHKAPVKSVYAQIDCFRDNLRLLQNIMDALFLKEPRLYKAKDFVLNLQPSQYDNGVYDMSLLLYDSLGVKCDLVVGDDTIEELIDLYKQIKN